MLREIKADLKEVHAICMDWKMLGENISPKWYKLTTILAKTPAGSPCHHCCVCNYNKLILKIFLIMLKYIQQNLPF